MGWIKSRGELIYSADNSRLGYRLLEVREGKKVKVFSRIPGVTMKAFEPTNRPLRYSEQLEYLEFGSSSISD